MNNKSYSVKERAKEILNILQKQDVNLENIDYNKLEDLLLEADKKGNIKVIK